jgi:hypothetical protein
LLPFGAQDIVKRLVSLQLLNLRQSVGLLGPGISLSQDRYLTQTQNKHTHSCLEWVFRTQADWTFILPISYTLIYASQCLARVANCEAPHYRLH